MRLKVIAWNVYQGTKPEVVRAGLADMIAGYNPDTFVLTEASGQYGQLNDLGYRVVQRDPGDWPHGRPMTEDGNVAILVRENLDIEKRAALEMSEEWLGPVHGIPHQPRVYRWVQIRKRGKTVKLGGFHWPFGDAAREESDRRVRGWFRWTLPWRPTIAVGDMNMRAEALKARVADAVGAEVAGIGIDLAAFKNCRLVSVENLGKRGSDHPAVLYVFEV